MTALHGQRRWTSSALREFFDRFAAVRHQWRPRGYHREITRAYQFLVPPGARVLEIGCGTGDLLADLAPSHGVGIDFSPEMIRQARGRHPQAELHFVEQVAEELSLDEKPFDYIIISDTVTYLQDILAVFRRLRAHCHPRTRVIANYFSRVWQPILALAELLRLRYPQPMLNWVTAEDIANLLHLAGYDLVMTDQRVLLPVTWPLVSPLCNRLLASLPGFRQLCLTNWVVARVPAPLPSESGVSVVVPCRNEAGNIREIVRRWPEFPGPSELILIEGHSQDDTWACCQEAARGNPERSIRALRQEGEGKGDAVRQGFAAARNDILVILDADLTTPPEALPGIVATLVAGHAEFVNGSRLLYPMDEEAMRFLNLVANKLFARLFSWLLRQPIRDTLCGAKALLRDDYRRLSAQRAYFGNLDPFGDFDLIFGAAKLGLKMRDYPVRYAARTYGTTQIRRFRDGWLLLRMFCRAACKLRWR